MKKVLLTGGAGFIGYHLSKYIADKGYSITIIDNFSRTKTIDNEFQELIDMKNVKFINADMRNKEFFKKLDNYYDFIYHLAAINGTKYFYEKPYEVLQVNILSLMNLLEWINESNCGKFLFSSSSEAYAGTVRRFSQYENMLPTEELIPLCIDDVTNSRFSYGGSKITGELLVENYFRKVKAPFSIVRYHNIYGPRMGFEHVLPEFCKRIYLRKNPFNIYGGEETRAFCYISDAVEATVMVMEINKCDGEILHIGNSYEEIKIKDMAKKLIKIANYYCEMQINEAPEGCVDRRCPNIDKIQKLTEYKPRVNLKTGLQKSLDWYLERYAIMYK